MRCKFCEYRLWNLSARTCPECGSPFRPSEFEFVLNSVSFLCPHCHQDYYGTGDDGHLNPAEFDCVQCGQHIHMDQMIVLPTQDVAEQQTLVDRNPWLERKGWGAIKAWFVMIGRGMFNPTKLIHVTPPTSSPWSAIWFACLTIFICAVTGGGILILFPFFAMLRTPGGGGGAAFSGVMLAFMALPTIGIVAFMLLWGLIAHGLLCMTGSTAGGIGRTYQAIGYSSGANIFTAVPCLSFYIAPIGWIWWAISSVLMLQEGQKVSGPRAAFAGLTPPLIAIVIVIGGVIFTFMTAMSGLKTAMSAMGNLSQSSVTQVTTAIVDHAADNSGQGPDHAARLIISDGVAIVSTDFLVQPTRTNMTTIAVGKRRLFELEYIDADKQALAVQGAADALPDNIIAHRLADLVFTYHGIDLTNADPNLWLVITSHDPTTTGTMPSSTSAIYALKSITVGKADGSIITIDSAVFPQSLIQQNKLRQSLKMPPIPDPATITHSSPATAP